ncbi:hypothetical protein BD626DRAFT_475444 [Schizophyllum amplum]|uniref:Zn(2)-C6 fungal-type domain-containing protein n=1 Tax=Schizophyllum amplum TaxID=97359 RepID=A0A550CYG0_9AGAR|nr:hypothetical protein BD626DRAFT_475444 [Auriculariopsis ampla]
MADSGNIGQSSDKKKRACDYCKARRVICHPRPTGQSCPRCEEKGIRCVTTIVPRRPRGRGKKTLAQEAAAAAVASPSNTAESSTSAASRVALQRVSHSPRYQQQTIAYPLESFMDSIPGSLLEDALDVMARMMPATSLLFPINQCRTIMQNSDWDIRLLAPQQRVLARCFLAVASLVSVDPFYVGHDANGRRFPDSHLRWEIDYQRWIGEADMREAGRRRRPLCARFYGEAVRQAHQDGITSLASKENAASCFLLNMLDITHNPHCMMPWASAYVWQARTIAEHAALDAIRTGSNRHISEVERVQWRGSLSALAAYSITMGMSLPFSSYDEFVVSGPEPRSVEDLSALGIPVKYKVIEALQSIGARSVRLTRDLVENIVGATALLVPLDEESVLRQVAATEHFHTTYMCFRRFIFSTVQTMERRLCLYSTSTIFASLTVSLYHTLRRRIGESTIASKGHASRMSSLRKRSRAIAARAVVDAVGDLREVIAAHWLGLLQAGGFAVWAEVFTGAHEEPIDECDVSAEECMETLSRLRDMMQFSAFMGIDRAQAVSDITAELEAIRARGSGGSSSELVSNQECDDSMTPESVLPSSHMLTAALDTPIDNLTVDASHFVALDGHADALALTGWWNYPTTEDSWNLPDMMSWVTDMKCDSGDVRMGDVDRQNPSDVFATDFTQSYVLDENVDL